MVQQDVNSKSRRDMIFKGLRYAAAGFLGIAAVGQISKRRRLVKEGKCENRGICAGCNVYDKCQLPQALSRKQVLSE